MHGRATGLSARTIVNYPMAAMAVHLVPSLFHARISSSVRKYPTQGLVSPSKAYVDASDSTAMG
jgi:hypothetical protein